MFQIVFAQLDSLAGFLPAWARISIWALVLGAVTMLLYARLSPQERIAEVKRELEEARRDLQNYTGSDFGPLVDKATRALSLALRQLRIMFLPTLVAAGPVIAALIWMEEDYKYELPDPGETVTASVEPAEALEGDPPEARWRPAAAVRPVDAGVELEWPSQSTSDPPRLVATDSDDPLVRLPLAAPRARVSRKSGWHWLFANPAGYLPASGPVDAVELDLPRRYVLPWGPGWMRTWHALFLVMLTISAVATKEGFDID